MIFFKDTFQSFPALKLLCLILPFSAIGLGDPLLFLATAPFGALIFGTHESKSTRSWLLVATILCLYFSSSNPWPKPLENRPSTVGTVSNALPGPEKQHFDIQIQGQKARVTLIGDCLPTPGSTLQIHKAPRPPKFKSNPGGFDAFGWMQSQGYSASFFLSCEDFTVMSPAHVYDPRAWLFDLSAAFSKRIDQSLPSPSSALLRAMLMGNDDFLDPDLASNFKFTGLTHILAISGFHIALFAIILQLIAGIFTTKRAWHYSITLVFLLLYGPLTGNPPSVQRAIVFYTLYAIGTAWGRKANALNSLFLTASTLILWNPKNLFDIGFQLSFLATFALLYTNLEPKENHEIQSWWSRFWDQWLWSALKSTFWATLVTAPLLAIHFYTLSLAGFIGNLFAVPISTGFMLTGALGLLAPNSWSIPWSISAQFCYDVLELGMNWLASFKFLQIPIVFDSPMQLVSALGIFVLFPLRSRLVARLCTYAFVIGLTFPPLINASLKQWNPSTDLWMLDVGQGDALVISTPSGHHLMIDNGAKNFKTGADQTPYVLAPFFKSQGITSLDVLILTHADLDHIGSTLSLLDQIETKIIYTNAQDLAHPKPELAQVLLKAKEKGIPVLPLWAGQSFKEDELHIDVLHPQKMDYEEGNHASIVLMLDYLGQRALLTGDLEEQGEADLLATEQNLRAQILKVGHHGSRNGTSRELLSQVQPDLALISAGQNNRYHHPHTELTERLLQFTHQIHLTAQKGYIHLRADDKNWYFEP